MDSDMLRQATEHAGLFALGVGFLAGLVFSFNPVGLASIPVSLAYVTKARNTQQSILFAVTFTVAMILVQVLLGFIAGFGVGQRIL
jgi:cytochrome c-type biogenesis protein